MRRRIATIALALATVLGGVLVSTAIASPASAHGKCEIVDGVVLCW